MVARIVKKNVSVKSDSSKSRVFKKNHSFFEGKKLILILLLLLSFFAFLIIFPFFNSIIAAATAAYIFLPLFNFFNSKIKNESLSAFIVIFILISFFIIPLLLAGLLLSKELYFFSVRANITLNDVSSYLSNLKLPSFLESSIDEKILTKYIVAGINNFSSTFSKTINSLLLNLLGLLLYIGIFLFLTFFFIRDNKKIKASILLFLKNNLDNNTFLELEKYFYKVSSSLNSVVRGTIIIALIQSILLIPMYYLVGLNTPIIWGVLTFLVALLPLIGVPLIWVPILILKTIEGFVLQDYSLLWKDLIFLLYAVFVISNIDNVLKPSIISSKSESHPVIIFLGILGGIQVFGVVGIIVGPVVLTALILLFNTIFIDKKITL